MSRRRIGVAALAGFMLPSAAALPARACDQAATGNDAAPRLMSGTRVLRWISLVEGRLEATAHAMRQPRGSAGEVIICLRVESDGRVGCRDICRKSGDAAKDRFALDVLSSAGPFPPPPPDAPRGLVWTFKLDGSTSLRFR